MKRRLELTSLGIIISLTLLSCTINSKVPEKPNIIYILADDLGYGDLGCYGQEIIRTPNIDKLALQGLKFTQHYAGSTVCAPSRCSLMTGLHTGHTYVRGNRATKPMGQLPLPESTVTVAKSLRNAGYSTALIGKWGLGGPGSVGTPNKQGFDYFSGYLCQRHAHNYYPEFLFRNDERVPLSGNRVDNSRGDGAGDGGMEVPDPEFFNSNGRLRGIMRDLYEGGIRVPMIAHWPDEIEPGMVSQHISAFWDFMPTACEIAGVDVPQDIDGISFLPTLTGNTKQQAEHENLYWEFHEAKYTKQAVRYKNWKLVKLDPSGPAELYNLDTDIEEMHDVSQDHPEILQKAEEMFNDRTESEHFEFRQSVH